MKYRKFGKLDWEVSTLGFGTMRLPSLQNNQSQIDELESIRMMRYAFDHGINYVDTAYNYGGGKSEIAVGKALKDGYRKKVR
ncbi:aldo/keto reductase, partial [Candidatus Bathyarchaeota archaeon]|nr:aldo/keto reductase [Candidatus Bathyarchaeota archaeon]